jgi:hypothetical protein
MEYPAVIKMVSDKEAKMFSPVAAPIAKNYNFEAKTLTHLLKNSSESNYVVINLNKKHSLPPTDVFSHLNGIIFVTRFPFSQDAIETIILASMLKTNRVFLAIKGIANSNDAKTALFTANQLEIPIIFVPLKNGQFDQIIEDIAHIWLTDARIRIDCYPVKPYFLSYIVDALGVDALGDCACYYEYQVFATRYSDHLFSQLPEIKNKTMNVARALVPVETMQDAIKRLP